MIKALLIATALAVAAAKDTYVVLTPKSFRPGIPLSVSIKILQSASTVHVTGDLVNKGNNQKVATATETFHQGTPGYLQIQVPDDLTSGSYKLQVHGLSSDLQFTNETDITYEGKSISIFIQTDKAMYKPGETVNFRAFAMFPNVSVYHGTYDVDIYDANTNKIKQWKGLTDASGVITNYLNMDSQPVLGDWKIKVYAHGRSTEKVFTVAHYVLPKFEVTVELPSYSLTSDSQITAKIIAKYTYGKPVKGTVSIKATIENWYRPYNYHGEEPAVTILDHAIDGEASLTIPLDHIKQINKYMNGRKILVEANVTESLNHITLSGNSNVQFYSHAVKLEFLKSNPKTFKPALPYTAYLKVSQQDDLPVAGIRKEVNITTSVTYEEKSVDPTPYPWYQPRQHSYNLSPQTFTVPDSGIVPIQVDIPANSTHISVSAHYGSVTTQLSLSKSYSPSDSYMQLFLKSTSLKAGQLAAFDIKGTEQVSNGVYQVMSRGSVVGIGSVSGDSFTIPITSKMAPNARVIVYYVRADGEVVTDSISFDVEGTFSNQVSLDFDKTKAQPGDSVNMVVNADPNSMAYLLAVDQSVLLLKSGNDITASQVVDELKSYDTIASTNMPIDFMGGGGMLIGRKKRMIWWPYPVYYGGSDAHQIFDNAGVKVITDASVYHHVEQHIYFYESMMGGGFGGGGAGGAMPMPLPGMVPSPISAGGSQPLASVDKIRTVFPETWLWSNTTIGY